MWGQNKLMFFLKEINFFSTQTNSKFHINNFRISPLKNKMISEFIRYIFFFFTIVDIKNKYKRKQIGYICTARLTNKPTTQKINK